MKTIRDKTNPFCKTFPTFLLFFCRNIWSFGTDCLSLQCQKQTIIKDQRPKSKRYSCTYCSLHPYHKRIGVTDFRMGQPFAFGSKDCLFLAKQRKSVTPFFISLTHNIPSYAKNKCYQQSQPHPSRGNCSRGAILHGRRAHHQDLSLPPLDIFIKQWNSYLNYIREHSLDDDKVKDENQYGAEDDGTTTDTTTDGDATVPEESPEGSNTPSNPGNVVIPSDDDSMGV